ncbi:hypothetical protein SPI_07533 [Niveomyces insectorum RCEF 264]|uniref:Uncharacterized protein n=1 Tax=Niveomyces insectorum RCEF 264 TaxID=1081102 RepID=A0A167PCN8_9HYPO|nr:hypothetical protein SPI_07533 [Niveomyces insectorum RCEF 264]
MASPIPICSYGNNSQAAQGVRAKLLPDYDVAHICLSLGAAESELPALCAGELTTEPSSGLGSNAGLPAADRKVPRAIVFGGGVPDDEVDRVTKAVQARAPGIKPIRIQRQEVLAAGAEGPNPDVIAKLLKEKLAAILGN